MSAVREQVPRRKSPKQAAEDSPAATEGSVELVLADKALTSLRASGHDYLSAVGEVFDNSIQANANVIQLRLFNEKRLVGNNNKKTEVIERLAVGDDGDGMPIEVLHRALQLGYSTRYNDRTGMGRFGVGAKLGGISQARRIELYSKTTGCDEWFYTYIDLEEIHNGSMRFIPVPVPATLPNDCADLVGLDHGTLVIWAKADRLVERDSGGARAATTVESDLVSYTARTFRRFLDGGIQITINDKCVKPHDPLFLMTTTRFHEGPNGDPVATVLADEGFEWEIPSGTGKTARVEFTITLLPESFRPNRGAGGSKEAKERRIDDNEGVSILRAGREIFYDYLRKVQPPIDKQPIDRWIGIEIRFPPELDECFQVRNVKKGAEPINGLRDKLKDGIWKTVETARSQIRDYWDKREAARDRERGVHATAEDIASRTKDSAPKPRAGQEIPQEERNQRILEVAKAIAKDNPEKVPEVEREIRNRPFTILPQSWPGSEFFEIEHLGSNAIVKLNMRHPFYGEVYAKLLTEIERSGGDESANPIAPIARLAQVGLDLLLLSYARAEGMRVDATEYYSNLRTQWSLQLKNMVQDWKKS
jgi:hypothetical protein